MRKENLQTAQVAFSNFICGLYAVSESFKAISTYVSDLENRVDRLKITYTTNCLTNVNESLNDSPTVVNAPPALTPNAKRKINKKKKTAPVKYRTPSFDDPVTQELVSKRWTWGSLCAMPERDNQRFVKEFIQAYQTYEWLEVVPQHDAPIKVKQLQAACSIKWVLPGDLPTTVRISATPHWFLIFF